MKNLSVKINPKQEIYEGTEAYGITKTEEFGEIYAYEIIPLLQQH